MMFSLAMLAISATMYTPEATEDHMVVILEDHRGGGLQVLVKLVKSSNLVEYDSDVHLWWINYYSRLSQATAVPPGYSSEVNILWNQKPETAIWIERNLAKNRVETFTEKHHRVPSMGISKNQPKCYSHRSGCEASQRFSCSQVTLPAVKGFQQHWKVKVGMAKTVVSVGEHQTTTSDSLHCSDLWSFAGLPKRSNCQRRPFNKVNIRYTCL